MRKFAHKRKTLVLAIVATDNTFLLQDGEWVGKCIHCNTKLTVTVNGNTDATIEHIVPKSKGNQNDDLLTLALACKRCNWGKGIRHDKHVGKGGRADEVIKTLKAKRAERWRDYE